MSTRYCQNICQIFPCQMVGITKEVICFTLVAGVILPWPVHCFQGHKCGDVSQPEAWRWLYIAMCEVPTCGALAGQLNYAKLVQVGLAHYKNLTVGLLGICFGYMVLVR